MKQLQGARSQKDLKSFKTEVPLTRSRLLDMRKVLRAKKELYVRKKPISDKVLAEVILCTFEKVDKKVTVVSFAKKIASVETKFQALKKSVSRDRSKRQEMEKQIATFLKQSVEMHVAKRKREPKVQDINPHPQKKVPNL